MVFSFYIDKHYKELNKLKLYQILSKLGIFGLKILTGYTT